MRQEKVVRGGAMTIEFEPTEDILAAASAIKTNNQRTVGFSLVERGDLARTREKLSRKKVDLIVYNPLDTMSSETIEGAFLWPDGHSEEFATIPKAKFAAKLITHCEELF
jgi:phosphopantothenoylcysteine decarboxylase/phosphopantothenate--cysteine ligase